MMSTIWLPWNSRFNHVQWKKTVLINVHTHARALPVKKRVLLRKAHAHAQGVVSMTSLPGFGVCALRELQHLLSLRPALILSLSTWLTRFSAVQVSLFNSSLPCLRLPHNKTENSGIDCAKCGQMCHRKGQQCLR